MMMVTTRVRRIALCGIAAASLVAVTCAPANAAGIVSQATAQAVNANVPNVLTVAISNPPTAASNDGTQSNAQVDVSPALSLLGSETFLTAGALKESVEANQDGSSYGCAGVVSPGGDIQVGGAGQTCAATGNGTGGVTLDLGELAPGLALLGGLKITVDSITAHGYLNGAGPAELDASVANLKILVGTTTIPLTVPATPNQPLLSAILAAITGSLGAVIGDAISLLLTPLLTLTANYQPAPEPDAAGTYSVTGLHIAVLGGALATVDLAKVTVGPNVPNAVVDAFSFQNLPLILGGLALLVLIGFGLRAGARRVRGLA